MAISDPPALEILDLPNEVQLQILDYLDFRYRLTASQVCRLWNALSFTGRFMNRICLCLKINSEIFNIVVDILSNNSRRYRHIVINFDNSWFHKTDQLAQVLSLNDSLETLVLEGFEGIESFQMLSLLESVPNLTRLFLFGDSVNRYQKSCLLEVPICKASSTKADDYQRWINSLAINITSDSSLVLERVENLCLITPVKFGLTSLWQLFPNITQLQLSGNCFLNATVYLHYKHQLKKIVILSLNKKFFSLFCEMSFPKLTYLYLDQMQLHDSVTVEKCVDFFKNPAHAGILRQLILHPKFMLRTPIFTTICSNCTDLRELELSLDYLDGDALKDVTNLRNLQRLTLQGTCYFRETPHCPYQIKTLTTVKIGSSRFPITLLEFIADIAPNLEALALEDVDNPEEMFRILPKLVRNIRHFEMAYSESFERPPSCHPSGYLRSLVCLETYCLRQVIIKHGIQGWLQDSPNLKQVLLTSCGTLTDTHLVILTTNCPKLRQLVLKDCSLITSKGIAEFKSRIPLCRIICDVR